MNVSRSRHTPDLAATWKRFKATRGTVLKNWVEAERALADARMGGEGDIEQGDRLLIAEAALQGAIMDFAASEDPESDPTRTAVALLRLAEAALEGASPKGGEKRVGQRRSGRDRRRHDLKEN